MRRHRSTVATALLLFCSSAVDAARPVPDRVAVEPAKSVRPVVLQDQDARDVAFPRPAASWRLVVFGFTHCPDVCPMTLHKTALLLKQLGAASDNVQVVFISIDGARDDPKTMKAFVRRFDDRITALTGDAESLVTIANEFGVLARRFQGKTAMAYTLVHSSLIYLLDPAGWLRGIYPQNVATEALAADLRRLWVDAAAARR